MTTNDRMNADLYRAAFARLGRWPARPFGAPNWQPTEAERIARQAEADRIRAAYAKGQR